MTEKVVRTERAAELPPVWDALADHYFQQVAFLQHAEIHNPCRQRYYMLIAGNILKAAAVVYSLKIDLLTYPRIKSPLTMQVTGIPCSVSCSGIFGESVAADRLKHHIFSREKGFKLALNLETAVENGRNAFGNTLPAIIMVNRFHSWQHYRSALRSDYRRRLDRICRMKAAWDFRITPCSDFTEEMYRQYLEVFRRSKAPLEKLSFSFFRTLPASFSLMACFSGEIPGGWAITLHHEGEHCFFMGGVNRASKNAREVYLLLMAEIVREGIEAGAKLIDLGQTAEIPKMRMGGTPSLRYMEAHLTLQPLNALLKRFSKYLEYRISLPETHIFHLQE